MAAALLRNAAAASREQRYFSEHTGPGLAVNGHAGASGISPKREVEAGGWCLSDSWGFLSLARKAHSSERSRTHCAVKGTEACLECQVPGCPASGNPRKLSFGRVPWPRPRRMVQALPGERVFLSVRVSRRE